MFAFSRKSASNGTASRPSHAIYRVEDCVKAMQTGTDIIKIKSRRNYRRRYFLNEDASYIYWEPTNKPRDEARINVSSIKEVRRGQNTESFCANGKGHEESCSFSIIHGDEYKSLDLVAATDEEASLWNLGLGYVMKGDLGSRSTEMKQQIRDRWLRKTFEDADKDGSGSLDEHELVLLAQRLNIGLPEKKLKEKFKQYDTDHEDESKGRLDINEFAALFKELSTRPEIYHLLMRYSKSLEYMRPEELKAFLETEQGEEVSIDQCETFIKTYEPTPEGREHLMLSVDGFTQFLIGEESGILSFHQRPVYQDMTQPLSHYFIASSHNTYLMEDQLKGPSSVEMYIRALRKGCRCVELDCWDGDDEPEIYHGYTLTSHILFKDVIAAVKEHAFATSEYPVILSLENHCSIPMQRKMAFYLKDILGDMLWVPDKVDVDFLPSPESLKGKVLIKGKKLKPEAEAETDGDGDDDDDGGDVSDEDEAAEMDETAKNDSSADPSSPTKENTIERKKKQSIAPAKKIKLAKTLSRVVTNHAVHFNSFEASASAVKPFQMSSFGESKTQKLVSGSAQHFVNYNKRQLSRIYPAGSRVTSSNYNPQMAWNVGCQIVALNYQTPGESMDLNDGRFQINGKSGYVLKPSVLRSEISTVDINSNSPIPGVTPCLLKIKVISGQTLPKPDSSGAKGEVIDPYVVIDIHGIPHDNYHKKTKTINNNGFNPVWDTSFRFLLKFPDVAMIRFTIFDDDPIGDDFIGQFSLPVSSTATGYRHVPLLSKTGERLGSSTIFVHIAKEPAYSLKKGVLTRIVTFGRGHTQPGKPRRLHCDSLDVIFLSITEDSLQSITLRRNLEKSLEKFRRSVGVSSSATMLRAVTSFAAKMKEASIEFHFIKQADELALKLKDKGEGVSEPILKTIQAFEEVLTAVENLAKKTGGIVQKLNDAYSTGEKKFPSLDEELNKANLKGRKLDKAREGFAWNMQMIKGQVEQLSSAKDSALYEMHQIMDAASSAGIEVKFEF